jgi:predicted  nucleic acid-binding Zn-ribbon protein
MSETANDIKIAKLETQMSNIESKVDDLRADVKGIANKLDSLADLRQELSSLREAHNEHVRVTEQEMRDIRESNDKEIKEIKSRNMLKGWLYPTLSAVMGSILTFLVIEYLTSARR